MNNKKVSVIIPTYNRFDVLFRALDSVLNQSYKEIEIIVVDDNYDNIELRNKIKTKIKEEYSNVIYLCADKHLGGALARNIGIENSSGDFIAFLDDDDEYKSSKIEEQLQLFLKKDDEKLALVYCYGDILYPKGTKELESTDYFGWPIDIQMYFNIAGTSFWMVKKEVLQEIGGFETIHSHQDGVVLLKIMSKGYKIDLVRESLVVYHAHSSTTGITGVTEKSLEADKTYFKLCEKYFYLIPKNKQSKVKYYYYKNRIIDMLRLNKIIDAKKEKKEFFKKTKNIYQKFIIWCLVLFRKPLVKRIILKDKKYEE